MRESWNFLLTFRDLDLEIVSKNSWINFVNRDKNLIRYEGRIFRLLKINFLCLWKSFYDYFSQSYINFHFVIDLKLTFNFI